MASIISFTEKRIDKKERSHRKQKELKILAVRKMFQCIRCAFKCEKCGASIESDTEIDNPEIDSFHIPYNFCNGCKEEYVAYVLYQKGKKEAEDYWRNDPWATLWKKWIEYQRAMDDYLRSDGFKQLIQELNEMGSEKEEE